MLVTGNSVLHSGTDPDERIAPLPGVDLGWDLTRPHCAVALHFTGPSPSRWASALSWLDRPTAREGRFAWTLAVPDEVPTTRLPTADELALIRSQLDPDGLRDKELT